MKFLFDNFNTLAQAPHGVMKLREIILQLAVQGKLVPQDPNDEPASILLEKIKKERKRLVKEGKVKAQKPLPPISDDEIPFELPKRWVWCRLGNIIIFNYGKGINKEDIGGKFPAYGANGILKYVKKPLVFTKCIIVGRKGTAGALNIVNKPFWPTDVTYFVTDSRDLDFIFTYNLLKSLKLERLSYGIKPGLNRNDAYKLLISLPPLEEQKRIVTKVDKLMALCDSLEEQQQEKANKRLSLNKASLNALNNSATKQEFNQNWNHITKNFDLLYCTPENVKELKLSILQLAVQGKLVPQDPDDEPASVLLENIANKKNDLIKTNKLKDGQVTKDSKSKIYEIDIPKAWSWAKGNEIFFITKLAGFEYTKYVKLTDVGEVAVIRAQNVRPLNLKLNKLKYIDLRTSELLERCALTKKALLVTFIGAGIGDVALFDKKERWHLAPNVAKMEPFKGCESKMNLRYFNFFLSSNLGKNEIFKHLKSTAQPSISMGTIRDIDYPIPPYSEQNRIAAKVDKLMVLCDNLSKSLADKEDKNEKLINAVVNQLL